MNRPSSEINLTKLIKVVLCQAVILMGLTTAIFSAEERSPIHIAVLEDPLGFDTPFAKHVLSPYKPPEAPEADPEFIGHGAAVCSVLVGEKSLLPKGTSITVVPTIDLFPRYLDDKNPKDLVILNWSGSIGYPGISEDVLEDINSLRESLSAILAMDGDEFVEQANNFIRGCDGMLAEMQGHITPSTDLLNSLFVYAKEFLLKAIKGLTEEDQKIWSSGFSERLDEFKKHGEEESKKKFTEMKNNIIKSLAQHDNTLIVWALGNEGKNIDDDPFWQELLGDDQGIINHTLLVYGTVYGRKHVESNFTIRYQKHALGRPFTTLAWNMDKSRYTPHHGTSFSAPLATMAVFIEAQQTPNPSYSAIKESLLKK
ncbi:MAG: hypothetical protein WCG04_03425 [Alphaproteobacteria bacterium]